MAKNETPIVAEILHALSVLRIVAWRQNSGRVRARNGWFYGAPTGTADIVGLLPTGRFFGIEVKTATGKAREKQLEWRERIERSGGVVGMARSIPEAMALMREWMAGKEWRG